MIAQTAAAADHEPVTPTPRLRLAMSWLTVSAGEGQALQLFWEDAREVFPDGHPDARKAYMRGTSLNLRLQGLCQRMGTDYEKVTDYARGMNAEWP